ncbi:hypothetical protein BDV29DRAFT_200473 [Aspergillus leporis]|uniref:Uncharacterized protein n=1 Tax=Aspergillus leporis TaxID=41062 RepID=A0A5N5X7Q5_9EURO|nr:hypothetical protein BDV29DRAFT_200473 [Aspergillus leporis]
MKASFVCQLLSLAALAIPSNLVYSLPLSERDLRLFEERYINSVDYTLGNDTIKLIGYKTIKIPVEELDDLNDHYNNHPEEWKNMPNYFYDQGSGTLRAYFPVEGALVEHDGQHLEANSLGELGITKINGDHSVLGRRQTDSITGVEGNIIKDGIIYLENAPKPHTRYGKVLVYDFGKKVVLGHDHGGHSKREGKKSCMKNHGGPNCSDKFNIHNSKCKKRHDICMDYNGWFSNCKKNGSTWRNFPGSDCDKALGRGHCWNEVM